MKTGNLKVCYVLSYRSPNYIRTITILHALSKIENISVLKAINTSQSIFIRYWETLLKLIYVRFSGSPDFYILGLRGHEIFWPVRLITFGKPLIFDLMMSPYDSFVNERRICRKGGLIDRLFYWYERTLLHNSDLILTDTKIHKEYFTRLFDLPEKKIHAIPVSTDEPLFLKGKERDAQFEPQNVFHVFFYGSFLPLHGVDIITEAAWILSDKPIHFALIGGERMMLQNVSKGIKAAKAKNISHHPWVEYEKLPGWMEIADLCLGGPFGNTGQGRRVITGKTFQFLAMGKPVVVGEIDDDYGFKDKVNSIIVRQGSAEQLAKAILWAYENQDKLKEIGRKGQKLYKDCFSINMVEGKFREIFGVQR